MKPAKRPGRPGRPGRPTFDRDGEPMKNRAVRMTDHQWTKFLTMGGSAWLRSRIDREKINPERKKDAP